LHDGAEHQAQIKKGVCLITGMRRAARVESFAGALTAFIGVGVVGEGGHHALARVAADDLGGDGGRGE